MMEILPDSARDNISTLRRVLGVTYCTIYCVRHNVLGLRLLSMLSVDFGVWFFITSMLMADSLVWVYHFEVVFGAE